MKLFKGALIYDGTGSEAFRGDVLVDNDIILKVDKEIEPEDGWDVVELDGLLAGDEGITATANGTLATPDAGKSKTVFISDITLSDSSKYQPAITSTQANVDIDKLVITGFEITAEDKVFDNPMLMKTPVVRNGKQATVGYCPEIWATWE